MKSRVLAVMAISAMTVLAAQWARAQAPAPAAASAAAPAGSLEGLSDMLPDVGPGETGNKEDVEALLRGDAGEKAGDLKKFEIRTESDIATLAIGDLYKNEETAYKIVAIKQQSAKGGSFTAQRIAGQSDPQRRWARISGVGPQVIVTRVTLLDLYRQGGVFLHPIAFLFVCLTVLTVNGVLVYRRKVQCAPEFVAASEAALRAGDMGKFESLSRDAKGLMPFICRHMAQDFAATPLADLRSRVEIATISHINRMRIPIRALNLISVAAPLLGLLGTIVGMVIVFEGVAGTSGAAKASILAAGIRVKLFSTAAALIVAIPALFIYFILNQKLGLIVSECEIIHERFMSLLGRIKQESTADGDSAARRRPNPMG